MKRSVAPIFWLMFGAGGQLVEVIKDRALALPPLNTTLARRLMEQTRIYTALKHPMLAVVKLCDARSVRPNAKATMIGTDTASIPATSR